MASPQLLLRGKGRAFNSSLGSKKVKEKIITICSLDSSQLSTNLQEERHRNPCLAQRLRLDSVVPTKTLCPSSCARLLSATFRRQPGKGWQNRLSSCPRSQDHSSAERRPFRQHPSVSTAPRGPRRREAGFRGSWRPSQKPTRPVGACASYSVGTRHGSSACPGPRRERGDRLSKAARGPGANAPGVSSMDRAPALAPSLGAADQSSGPPSSAALGVSGTPPGR
ncbi:uncharacterized protein LOC126076499 [Elephas maximus indicus]|uniref:uncharacterized protein LOC126076499 n=1 Tax=Elephas maximus indicus TaxID=99487 RepID=UPI002115EBDF|nr:uncharacterized protein LOC126076499 [Elephas maximus indicus]